MIFKAEVRDLSHKGLGVIDHPDGRTFFVRGTWPGDVGEFEISPEAAKYSEARLVKVLSPSKNRQEPFCEHRGIEAGLCGGCPWMIGSYESQLLYKVKRLKHALIKRGVVIGTDKIKSTIPSPKVLGYRNRIQLKTTGNEIGFVSEGSSTFAPVRSCGIVNEKLSFLFHELKNSLPRPDLAPTEGHKWSYVDLDDEMVLSEVVANRRRPFRQGNSEQNEAMRRWIEEKFSPLPRHYPVIDLFCGSGNFTEVLSHMGFTNILAVEVQGVALEALEKKKLKGVRILPLDINQKGSWAQIARAQPHAKAMLLDPPREGINKRRGLYKYLDNLESIFYISCELDTFSRDVGDMIQNGWDLKEITPLDLFPHTPHIEILGVLIKHHEK